MSNSNGYFGKPWKEVDTVWIIHSHCKDDFRALSSLWVLALSCSFSRSSTDREHNTLACALMCAHIHTYARYHKEGRMPLQMVSHTDKKPVHSWQTHLAPVPGENVCISNWPRKSEGKKGGDTCGAHTQWLWRSRIHRRDHMVLLILYELPARIHSGRTQTSWFQCPLWDPLSMADSTMEPFVSLPRVWALQGMPGSLDAGMPSQVSNTALYQLMTGVALWHYSLGDLGPIPLPRTGIHGVILS